MTLKTTNLSIISKDTSSGDHDCIVIAKDPLWIKELILSPSDHLGAPRGRVTPGTPPNGSLRTISVDSSNSVFTTAAPFTLSVTYDSGTFLVTDVHVVQAFTAAATGLFGPMSEGLAELSSDDQAVFLTQVLGVVSPPPAFELLAGASGASAASKSYTRSSENGADSTPQLS
jgi:hypothetical protein